MSINVHCFITACLLWWRTLSTCYITCYLTVPLIHMLSIRPRRHDCSLIIKEDARNFVIRLLYKDIHVASLNFISIFTLFSVVFWQLIINYYDDDDEHCNYSCPSIHQISTTTSISHTYKTRYNRSLAGWLPIFSLSTLLKLNFVLK